MTWSLDSDRPIYAQLMEHIQTDIISGRYQAGQKLPSVRELAADAGVNPNTMQKALSELERNGLVFSQRTSGRFITEDVKMIQDIKKELATEQIGLFFTKMKQLGFREEETIELIRESMKEEQHEQHTGMQKSV